jgi:N6-L-threonylcarbamoyladenine synthase
MGTRLKYYHEFSIHLILMMLQFWVKNKPNPTILAIETSCDETAVAVTRGSEILTNQVFSQTELHKQYGGVVPDLARTAHREKFPQVYTDALAEAGITEEEIEAVAVTVGPGLAIALEVGIIEAKKLAERLKVPLIAEGHLVSVLARKLGEGGGEGVGVKEEASEFPALGVLVSGGHTEFILVKALGDYQKIGHTLDDAVGEAFDKVSNMLGLGYPGGPLISRRAEQGSENLEFKVEQNQQSKYMRAYSKDSGELKYELPIPMAVTGDLNMSYSGLKTAVKHVINHLANSSELINIRETGEAAKLTELQTNELASLFQQTAISAITIKLETAIRLNPEVKEIWLGGGVAANKLLQDKLNKIATSHNLKLRLPSEQILAADNAAMIGIAAGFILDRVGEGRKAAGVYDDPEDFGEVERQPNLSL